MSSYSSLNNLLPPSENTSILGQHYTNGVSLEEGKQPSSSLLRNTGQNRGNSQNLNSNLKVRVLSALLIFLFVTICFAIASFLHFRSLPCTSQSCVLTSSLILNRMDPNVSPCDDFYQFSCGAWMNQSVDYDYASWNTLYETQVGAHNKIAHAIHKILAGTFPVPLNEGEKAAAELFRQCTDIDTLEQIGLNTWRRFVEEIGGWMPELSEPTSESTESQMIVVNYDEDLPNSFKRQQNSNRRGKFAQQEQENGQHEIENAILMAFNYSIFPLFWAGVEVNYLDSTSYLITIYEQLPLLLQVEGYYTTKDVTPEMIYNRKDVPQVAEVLMDIGLELAELLNFDKNDEQVKRMVANMIHLEYKISITGSTFYKEKKELYEIITLADLQKVAPAIDWRYFLSRLVGESLNMNERIAIKTGVRWISTLSKIIEGLKTSRQGVAVIKNYIKWKTLLFHLAYVEANCTSGMLWLAVKFYAGPPNRRKDFCMLRVSGMYPLSLPSILRKLDGTEKSDNNKEMVKDMANKISDEYLKVFEKSETIADEMTRKNVMDKISNASILVSFPDAMTSEFEMEKEASRIRKELFWSMISGSSAVYREKLSRLRRPVDPRDWVDTRPALSTPAHNYERNVIQIPFDTLRLPLGDSMQMDFANYARIGSIIGHELTHGFDAQGKLHGPTGNLGNWWSPESKKRFSEKEHCFIQQYTSLMNTADTTAAKIGLYENIADSAGLKVSYEAWRSNGNDVDIRIAGIDNYNTDQLFFLAYTQGWCALKSKNKFQVHMAEKIRMLGALQNSQEFSKAWNCPAKSFMNPTSKCNVW